MIYLIFRAESELRKAATHESSCSIKITKRTLTNLVVVMITKKSNMREFCNRNSNKLKIIGRLDHKMRLYRWLQKLLKSRATQNLRDHEISILQAIVISKTYSVSKESLCKNKKVLLIRQIMKMKSSMPIKLAYTLVSYRKISLSPVLNFYHTVLTQHKR